jgi:hypothetical protein
MVPALATSKTDRSLKLPGLLSAKQEYKAGI